jgi:hypothetical protein
MRCQTPRFSLLLACAVLLLPACTTGGRRAPNPGIASLWREYLALPPERALALAGNPDRLWVGAVAGGQASRVEAEQSALAECRKRRAIRRMQQPCRLYATGDEIVW